jgi:hypothetical protein
MRDRFFTRATRAAQIGEAAAAGDDVVELAKLLVAPVIAALGEEPAGRIELHARLVAEPGRRGGVGRGGRGRAGLDEAGERRERLDARQGSKLRLSCGRGRIVARTGANPAFWKRLLESDGAPPR